jgi:16S rRNA processing protein RimM
MLGADGRSFVVSDWRPAPGGDGNMFVVRVDGVTDRTAAEALARLMLHLPRERLPALADDDEFYLADLVGLSVEHAGVALGRVLAVHDFGAGDVLEIAPADAGEEARQASVMVPFTKAVVPSVDIAAGRLLVAANPFTDAEPAERE